LTIRQRWGVRIGGSIDWKEDEQDVFEKGGGV